MKHYMLYIRRFFAACHNSTAFIGERKHQPDKCAHMGGGGGTIIRRANNTHTRTQVGMNSCACIGITRYTLSCAIIAQNVL